MKRLVATAMLLIILIGNCGAAYAADELGTLMEGYLRDLVTVLKEGETEGGSTVAQKAREFIDFKSIARGVIGKHAMRLSDAQTQEFQIEFEQSMLQLLREVVASLDPYEISIEKISKRRDTRAQVLGVVELGSGERFELLTSIAWVDERWKVRNITANGVNLGLTYRNQFSELMKTHSGNGAAAIGAWSESITLPEPKAI